MIGTAVLSLFRGSSRHVAVCKRRNELDNSELRLELWNHTELSALWEYFENCRQGPNESMSHRDPKRESFLANLLQGEHRFRKRNFENESTFSSVLSSKWSDRRTQTSQRCARDWTFEVLDRFELIQLEQEIESKGFVEKSIFFVVLSLSNLELIRKPIWTNGNNTKETVASWKTNKKWFLSRMRKHNRSGKQMLENDEQICFHWPCVLKFHRLNRKWTMNSSIGNLSAKLFQIERETRKIIKFSCKFSRRFLTSNFVSIQRFSRQK